MTTIYCKRNGSEAQTLDFYVVKDREEFFLFSQKKIYAGLEKHYSRGVSLNDAINHSKGKTDYMIHKTMTKLPVYLRYVEKEYGITLLDQSKKRLRKAA